MNLSVEFTRSDGFICKDTRIHRLSAVFPFNSRYGGIGVDPGRNFGITYLSPKGYAYVHYGKLMGDEMAVAARDVVYYLQSMYEWDKQTPVVIEGAAFGAAYGQVKLEHIRTGFFFGFHTLGFRVSHVPPATARKDVLGNGKKKADEIWPIKGDAAASLNIALYAAGYKTK